MKHWRRILVGLVLLAATAFFARELSKNVEALNGLEPRIGFELFASIALTVFAILLGTEVWRVTMNMMAAPAHLPPMRGFAILNISSFAKYLPGKLWSIGVQTSWLAKLGFAPTVVVGANLLTALVSSAVSFSIGGVYLLYRQQNALGYAGIGLIALAHVALALQGERALAIAGAVFQRVFKRKLEIPAVRPAVIVIMQVGYTIFDLCFGAAAYFAGQSLGLSYGLELLPVFLCGIPVANVIGFAALLIPGGIGVREGILYMALHEAGGEIVALTVPIWTRLLTMGVELSMFGLAFLILRGIKTAGEAVPSSR